MLKSFLSRSRERGFTLVELIVVVLIVGILAAIAIPVYLGIQAQAAQAALRADVNITVKRVQVALTEGATLAQVTENYGAAYVPTSSTSGESIRVYGVDNAGTVITAGFMSQNLTADDEVVTSDALYHGLSTPVFTTVSSVTKTVRAVQAAAAPVDFTVAGALTKSAGANVDYAYGYASTTGKFTDETSLGGGTGAPAAVAPKVTSAAMGNGIVNSTTYNLQLTASGAPTATFTVTGLPTGVTFNSVTNKITGKPTATGTYNVTVTATNSAGSDVQTASVKVTADPGTVSISQATVSNPAVGQLYQFQLSNSSTGTAGAITWGATNIPTGLTMTAGGTITGTATTAGSYPLTVTVTKTLADGAVATDTKVYNLFVATPAAKFDFESGGMPAGWLKSSSYAGPSTTSPYKGSYSLYTNDSSISYLYYRPSFTLGKSYTMSGWVKAAGTCTYAFNGSSAYTSWAYSNNWAYFSTTFTYDGSFNTLTVQASAYSNCYLDELAFTPNS